MRVISHRGNVVGADRETENSPRHIQNLLNTTSFDVEIDVWKIGDHYFLGHDEPKYEIGLAWLRNYSERFWLHAKNLAALENLGIIHGLHCFWHENDKYTLTSYGRIWIYPGQPLSKIGVIVHLGPDFKEKDSVYGICTDYPLNYES